MRRSFALACTASVALFAPDAPAQAPGAVPVLQVHGPGTPFPEPFSLTAGLRELASGRVLVSGYPEQGLLMAFALNSHIADRSPPGVFDDVASNVPHVVASEDGACYARSVPDSLYYSQAGHTMVYGVNAIRDQVLADFRWYSRRIFLHCSVADARGGTALSVVRLGPTHRGRLARAQDLGIAFYRDDRLLKSYSTLDLAQRPARVRTGRSHYSVIDTVLGYRHMQGNQFTFDFRVVDGRVLRIDAATGLPVP